MQKAKEQSEKRISLHESCLTDKVPSLFPKLWTSSCSVSVSMVPHPFAYTPFPTPHLSVPIGQLLPVKVFTIHFRDHSNFTIPDLAWMVLLNDYILDVSTRDI